MARLRIGKGVDLESHATMDVTADVYQNGDLYMVVAVSEGITYWRTFSNRLLGIGVDILNPVDLKVMLKIKILMGALVNWNSSSAVGEVKDMLTTFGGARLLTTSTAIIKEQIVTKPVSKGDISKPSKTIGLYKK